jgi:hypothetical protein
MEIGLAPGDELGEHLVSVFGLVWSDTVLVPDPFGLETPLVTSVEAPTLMRAFDSDPAADNCGHRGQNRDYNFPDPECARAVRNDDGDRNGRRS